MILYVGDLASAMGHKAVRNCNFFVKVSSRYGGDYEMLDKSGRKIEDQQALTNTESNIMTSMASEVALSLKYPRP